MKRRNVRRVLRGSAGLAGGVAAFLGLKKAVRGAIGQTADSAMKKLMTEPYQANLYELVSSVTRTGLQEIVETNLRSQQSGLLQRPMGSPRRFPSLDMLTFAVAQLHVMPTQLHTPVELSCIIGKKAAKPLRLTMPLMIGGMGYGVGISKNAKIALAKGAAMSQVAVNSGQGPILDEDRRAAHQYIYQFNRSTWGNRKIDLENCDAIEIQVGQGAMAGVGHVSRVQNMDRQVRRQYGFSNDVKLVSHSRLPQVQQADQLAGLVASLKQAGGGVPVGIKIAAGKYLEADMQIACDSGADFICVSSAEAGSNGSPPILQDDFGIPSLYAFSRAGEWMDQKGYKSGVSLIASGKIRTPGDMLKALALGADACYIGTIALFAISHTQLAKVLPFEPPTQLTWYGAEGEDRFDPQEGAMSLHRFLSSFRDEVTVGVRALGKTRITDVCRSDLVALEQDASRGCGVPMAYEAFAKE